MDMNQYLMTLPGIGPEEMQALSQCTQGMNEEQKTRFYNVYISKRKNPQDTMLFTLLGFVGFAGIQRLMLGQVAMGIIYFITCGFCFIGTVVDLVNYQSMTFEYNRKMMIESTQMLQFSQF